MVDISSSVTIKEVLPALGLKLIKIETPATADNADTIAITLSDYGISTVEAVLGFTHSTTDSVIITEAPTTAVASGVLTITIAGTTANKKRVFLVLGEAP